MRKILRLLLSLVVCVVTFGVTAIPVYAASPVLAYPQIPGEYITSGSILMHGLDGKTTHRYTSLDIVIATQVDGALGVVGAIAGDAAVYTDQTDEANDATASDMTLLPATPAVNDTYTYISSVPYNGIRQDITTQGNGTWTITWEFWNGTAYAAIENVTDGTSGFTAAAGNHDVTWPIIPPTWAKKTITLDANTTFTGYVARACVSAYTSKVQAPVGDQAWILCDAALTGTAEIVGSDRETESELTGWVGYGKNPKFVLIVKDVQDATGFYAEIQGTVKWNSGTATINGISGIIYGHYISETQPYYFSGTLHGPWLALD